MVTDAPDDLYIIWMQTDLLLGLSKRSSGYGSLSAFQRHSPEAAYLTGVTIEVC